MKSKFKKGQAVIVKIGKQSHIGCYLGYTESEIIPHKVLLHSFGEGKNGKITHSVLKKPLVIFTENVFPIDEFLNHQKKQVFLVNE